MQAGTTHVSWNVVLRRTADSLEYTGRTAATLTLSYQRPAGARVGVVASDLASVTSPWQAGGVKEVDAGAMPGTYRIDWPDAAFATGAAWVQLTVTTPGGFAFNERVPLEAVSAYVPGSGGGGMPGTATALDLITAALIKIRVHRSGTTVPNEDAQDALDELNRLLESLALENWPIYRVVDIPHVLPPGTASLTLGAGGAVNTVRPLALQDSYTAINDLSYPYAVVGVDQWNLIGRKGHTGTAVQLVYYDPAYPLGVAHLWPVPSSSGTIHLQAVQQWSALTILEALSMPPGYRDFLVHRLSKRLAPSYGAVLGGEFLEEARRVELAIYRQRKQPVIAEINVPFLRGSDSNWILTGGL